MSSPPNLNKTNTLPTLQKTLTNTYTNKSKTNISSSTKPVQLNSQSSLTSRTVITKNTATGLPSLSATTTSAAINSDKTNYTKQISSNNINNSDKTINFASITANETTPNREQAIVFNSIVEVPQKNYIIAIGQIVKLRNILFVSKISNNRFCIFLSSNEILEFLLTKTQIININGHEIQLRRLLQNKPS